MPSVGLSAGQLVLASAVIAVGTTVQAAVGFGLGLVAAPLLALISPDLVPIPILLIGLITALSVAVRERRSVDLGGLKWSLVGRVFGAVGAAVLASRMPGREASIVFGGLVLLAVTMSLLGIRLRPTRAALVGAGSLSGFMGTLTSIGTPPMALVYQRAAGDRLRATMSAYPSVGVAMSIAALALTGSVGRSHLVAGVVLLPGMIAGLIAAATVKSTLDRGRTRPAVLTLSAAASIAVILRQLV